MKTTSLFTLPKQSANATKNPVVAHNKSRIPQKDLTRLLKAIALERNNIIACWYDYFGK